MPELPELEVIKEVLQAHIIGQTITEVEIRRPPVLRDLAGGGFAPGLTGRSFAAVARRGKFLLCTLSARVPPFPQRKSSVSTRPCAAH